MRAFLTSAPALLLCFIAICVANPNWLSFSRINWCDPKDFVGCPNFSVQPYDAWTVDKHPDPQPLNSSSDWLAATYNDTKTLGGKPSFSIQFIGTGIEVYSVLNSNFSTAAVFLLRGGNVTWTTSYNHIPGNSSIPEPGVPVYQMKDVPHDHYTLDVLLDIAPEGPATHYFGFDYALVFPAQPKVTGSGGKVPVVAVVLGTLSAAAGIGVVVIMGTRWYQKRKRVERSSAFGLRLNQNKSNPIAILADRQTGGPKKDEEL